MEIHRYQFDECLVSFMGWLCCVACLLFLCASAVVWMDLRREITAICGGANQRQRESLPSLILNGYCGEQSLYRNYRTQGSGEWGTAGSETRPCLRFFGSMELDCMDS